MDGAVGLSTSEQGAALLKVRRISAEIDRTPDKASGDTHFGTHAFNDIARQFNALERALPASSPVKVVRGANRNHGLVGPHISENSGGLCIRKDREVVYWIVGLRRD